MNLRTLLFTFAFGGLIASFRGAVQTSMQFEAVKVRLNSMFGSVERGTKGIWNARSSSHYLDKVFNNVNEKFVPSSPHTQECV